MLTSKLPINNTKITAENLTTTSNRSKFSFLSIVMIV